MIRVKKTAEGFEVETSNVEDAVQIIAALSEVQIHIEFPIEEEFVSCPSCEGEELEQTIIPNQLHCIECGHEFLI